MDAYHRMNDLELDVLKEIGNIGAGNAATALSKLLNKHVDLKVPDAQFIAFDEVADFVGGDDTTVVAVYLRVTGDVTGNMFLVFTQSSAKNLVHKFIGMNGDAESFTDMEFSAVTEIGNMLAGSYLSALADFTRLNMQPSIPHVAVDMAAAILSVGLAELSQYADYALLIDTTFMEGNEEIQGHVILLPTPDSIPSLFQALGVPNSECD